jgi:hypothetical protein
MIAFLEAIMVIAIRHLKWLRWCMKFLGGPLIEADASEAFDFVLPLQKLSRLIVVNVRDVFFISQGRSA